MKSAELLEWRAKAPPEAWVTEEQASFVALVRRYGFDMKTKPFHYRKQRWVFGGQINPKDESIMGLSMEKRLLGLQAATAKKLYTMRTSGREVGLVSTYHQLGSYNWLESSVRFRRFWEDDTLPYIETRVKEAMYTRVDPRISKTPFIIFQYYVDPLPPVEAPVEPPKRVLRVIKAPK
jgi:hypothetical protein